MVPDPARDGYIRLIEARPNIDGRFTTLRWKGDGHFSLVFAARDTVSSRDVAIKVFRPDRLVEPYRFQCFCREAIILERLKGTRNIIGWVANRGEFTEQIQTTAGIPFPLTFPYYAVELASTDASAFIRNGTWNPGQKLVAFREMCKAVQRVHRGQIAHRDIKPSNFLVMGNGELRLSDFGTARDLGGDDTPILPNYLMAPGDTRYTAPEMLALLHDDDPSIALLGDLYSLGATLFELLSGTILGVQMFRPNFACDLAMAMGAVQKRDRRRIYLQFVQSIASGHPLPSITDYGTHVPSSIIGLLDELYKSMAALDFRLNDFERLFLRIDQCLLLLRNDEKVRQWRRQKEVFKCRRAEKQAAHEMRTASTRHAGECR